MCEMALKLLFVCVQRHVIGLARDLRGIAFAFNTKVSYMMLFDWLYPCMLSSQRFSVSN